MKIETQSMRMMRYFGLEINYFPAGYFIIVVSMCSKLPDKIKKSASLLLNLDLLLYPKQLQTIFSYFIY